MIFIKILKHTIQIKNERILLELDYMIVDVLSNKKIHPTITKVFIRGIKLNTYLAFITQPYFAVSKCIRLNSTQYLVMKTPNKRELQQIEQSYGC